MTEIDEIMRLCTQFEPKQLLTYLTYLIYKCNSKLFCCFVVIINLLSFAEDIC